VHHNSFSTTSTATKTTSSLYEVRPLTTTTKSISTPLTSCFAPLGKWTKKTFTFEFDTELKAPILTCGGDFTVDLTNASLVVGGSGGFRVEDIEGLPKPNPAGDIFAFGLCTGSGYFIFCSDDESLIADWMGVLSSVLVEELRTYFLAKDSTSLSGHVYDLLKQDRTIGLLKNADIRVNVNVCDGERASEDQANERTNERASRLGLCIYCAPLARLRF